MIAFDLSGFSRKNVKKKVTQQNKAPIFELTKKQIHIKLHAGHVLAFETID